MIDADCVAGKLIMGIGHRVKSLNNPDKRVELLKAFAADKTKFAQPTPFLDFALEVEKVTTSKVSGNLEKSCRGDIDRSRI